MISPSSAVAVIARQGGIVRALDRERMVARGRQRRRKVGENAAAVVDDRRHLAVHHALRANDLPAERLADRLVAEAYAQDRNPSGEALDQRHRNPGLAGRARPGRDDDLFRLPRRDLLESERVVAMDVNVRAQLAEILDEVVGEAVVVVDQAAA